MVLEVTDATFEKEVIRSRVPTVLYFWADWNAASIEMIKSLKELEPQFERHMKFCKTNIDTNKIIAKKTGARAVPYTMIFNDEEVLESVAGIKTTVELRKKFDLALASLL